MSPARGPATLFITYRRDDTAPHAGRLYDRLTDHFGDGHVFIDIDQIDPGEDFVDAINTRVGACDVTLVLIGRNWLNATDAAGERRLDQPEDFVRMEIIAALERNIRVIPVLVGGARMPGPQDLPEPLKALARRNAIEISETRFHSDVDRLIEAIDKSFLSNQKRGETRHAVPTRDGGGVQSHSRRVDAESTVPRGKGAHYWRRVWPIGVVLGLILLAWFWSKNALNSRPASQPLPSPDATPRLVDEESTATNGDRIRGITRPPITSSVGLKLNWVEPLGLWVGQYEVTESEYRAVMGSLEGPAKGPRRPVDRVNLSRAKEFCRALTEKDRAAGVIGRYLAYRLPTSREYDTYVANATLDQAVIGLDLKGPVDVGTLKPNRYGLYDVRGNVWEWMSDEVLRGACWNNQDAKSSELTYQLQPNPKFNGEDFGFRCVVDQARLNSE